MLHLCTKVYYVLGSESKPSHMFILIIHRCLVLLTDSTQKSPLLISKVNYYPPPTHTHTHIHTYFRFWRILYCPNFLIFIMCFAFVYILLLSLYIFREPGCNFFKGWWSFETGFAQRRKRYICDRIFCNVFMSLRNVFIISIFIIWEKKNVLP